MKKSGHNGQNSDLSMPIRAFVTGGTGGIGKQIVRELLRKGFHVDFSFNKSAEKVPDVFRENSDYHHRLGAVKLDLLGASVEGIPPDVQTMLQNASILVNNAAISEPSWVL